LSVEPIRKESAAGKPKKVKPAVCTALVWNPLGKKLFAGYNDGYIRVWHVASEK